MDIKTCEKCHGLFRTDINARYCQSCSQEVNKLMKQIKEYLHQNAKATLEEVCKHFEVPKEMILEWNTEENFGFENEAVSFVKCERCGVIIDGGRYCDDCKLELASGIAGALGEVKRDKKEKYVKPKMHFLNRRK